MRLPTLLTIILFHGTNGLECWGWSSADPHMPSTVCDSVCNSRCKDVADRGKCMVEVMGTQCIPPGGGPTLSRSNITCNGWLGTGDVTNGECDAICSSLCESSGDLLGCMSQVQPSKCVWRGEQGTGGGGSGQSLCTCLEPAFAGVTAEACELMCESGNCGLKASLTEVVDCVQQVAGDVPLCKAAGTGSGGNGGGNNKPTTTTTTTTRRPPTTTTTTTQKPGGGGGGNGQDPCEQLTSIIPGIPDTSCVGLCQHGSCGQRPDFVTCVNELIGFQACTATGGGSGGGNGTNTNGPPCSAYHSVSSNVALSDQECISACESYCDNAEEGRTACMDEFFPVCAA